MQALGGSFRRAEDRVPPPTSAQQPTQPTAAELAAIRVANLRKEINDKEAELSAVNVEIKRTDRLVAEAAQQQGKSLNPVTQAALGLASKIEQLLPAHSSAARGGAEKSHSLPWIAGEDREVSSALKKITIAYVSSAAAPVLYDFFVDDATTFADVLKSACEYWGVNPSAYVLQDENHVLWPLRARVVDAFKRESVNSKAPSVTLRRIDQTVQTPASTDPSLGNGDKKTLLSADATTTAGVLDDEDALSELPSDAIEQPAEESVNADDAKAGAAGPKPRGGLAEADQLLLIDEYTDSVRPERSSSGSLCLQCELILALALVIVFLVVSLSRADVARSFRLKESVRRVFVPAPRDYLTPEPRTELVLSQGPSLMSVSTQEEAWTWMSEVFLPAYSEASAEFEPLNTPQICQLRVQPNEACAFNPRLFGASDACNAPYGSAPDTAPHPNPPPNSSSIYPAFFYGDGVDSDQWPGLVQDYVPGSYLVYPLRSTGYCAALESADNLTALRESRWWDASTRLIQINFDLYDSANAAAVNALILFETQANGGVIPHIRPRAVLLTESYVALDVVVFCVVLVLVLLTLFGRRERPFLMLFDLMALICTILLIVGQQQVRDALDVARALPLPSTGGAAGVDLRGIALQLDLIAALTGVVVAWGGFRVLSYLDASPSVSVFFRAARANMYRHLSLSFIVVVLAISFGLLGFFVFGRAAPALSAFDLAMAALTVSWGPPAGPGMASFVGVATWGALILSAVVFVLFYLLLFWTCFASNALAYLRVRDEIRARGHHWLVETDPAAAQSAQVAALSGAVFGHDADAARKDFKVTERFPASDMEDKKTI